MKDRFMTRMAATMVLMGLISALTLPLSLRSASADELLTYKGQGRTATIYPCETSDYEENCPTLDCSCVTSEGFASGDFTGAGFAAFDMTLAVQAVNGCHEFNASMFIIASKDLEELDFSGTFCEQQRTYSGNYVLAKSKEGFTGSGAVSGRIKTHNGNGDYILKFDKPTSSH
jgi:hypothetical protein